MKLPEQVYMDKQIPENKRMLMVHGDTDKDLWKKMKSGSKSSFCLLFREYYSRLYYYGIKLSPGTDVKECIQEVFIRIWETRGNLGDVENVRSYLFVSLRRKILTRKQSGRRHVKIGPDEQYTFHFELNEFERHEHVPGLIRDALLMSLNALSPRQREIILLFFYQGLSYQEISKVMGISVEVARNLMYRSLIHLRKTIGERSLHAMKKIFFNCL